MASGKNRRETLLIALGLVGVAAGWQVWIRRPRPFDFIPLEGLPGWRSLPRGEVSRSASGAVFAGLGAEEPPEPLELGRLCDVLFGGRRGPGVPLAVFTDFNCPYCRAVAPSLAALSSEGKIALNWLEWPIYGGRSVEVARALVAAEEIGMADALRGPLYAGPPRPLSRVIDDAGLSRRQLLRRMEGETVTRRLEEIERAAQLLRLFGTPSMMVGRTLVVGAPPTARLERLIEIEAAEGPLPCR